MRTLLSPHLESNLLVKFPSISFAKGKPIFILHCRGLLNPRNTISSSFRASYTANSSTSYNGWDDLRIWVDSDELGESNLLKKILISLGINDRKYVVTCILGFVCALAISRVKVSSIIVFPAAAIVFAVGYWFGFVNGKPHKGLSLNGSKRRVKDDSFRFYDDKLKTLLEIFDGFDIKNGDLKNNIKKAIEDERVDFDDLETYMNTVETLEGLILNARNMVEDFIGDSSVERKEVEKKPYQNSRKKKDTGDKGFEVLGFLGNFLKDNPVDSNSSSKNFMRNILAKDVDDRDLENLQSAEVESDPISNEDSSKSKATLTDGSRIYRKSKYNGGDNEPKRILSGRKSNRMEAYMNTENFLKADEYNYQNLRFSSDERVRLNVSAHRKIRKWAFDDSLSSNTEFDISNESLVNGPSLKSQQLSENANGAYMSSEGKENVGIKSFGASIREERMTVEDELYTRKYQSQSENGLGSFSSSTVSDDMLFDTYVRNANELLKQAKECLKARNDETFAEEKLQKSAELLCKAITLKPLSLPAIGQLGNTYLLHGELKLNISRELRNLLSESDDFGVERSNLYFLEDTIPSKGGLENLLSSACEECEALLVEAGRKYRMALSIDRNDVKALYNWGLALSFRAQLIADVGPDAALDADKLFLAAIDKFNAMMSRNNDYAPEALFRWGMALQQRSRLRPSNSRDKVKLLQQAKRLYEDAVKMGSNNLQVRKALSSCISELNFTDI